MTDNSEPETYKEGLPKRPHRRKRWVCGPKRSVKGSTRGLKELLRGKDNKASPQGSRGKE